MIIKFKVSENSLARRANIEAQFEVLSGINGVEIDSQTGVGRLDFNENLIGQEEIEIALEESGARLISEKGQSREKRPAGPAAGETGGIKEASYFVQGMHCASCEILIEKRLLQIPEVKAAESSAASGKVLLEYEGKRPKTQELNRIFSPDGYSFSNEPFAQSSYSTKNNGNNYFFIAGLIILAFLFLNRLGINSWLNITSGSTFLPAFFLLGILAGLSSCAALVGGIILSMSKQWLEVYQKNDSIWQKMQPHLLFNSGRLVSYGFFGAVLGLIGGKLQLTPSFSALLTLAVSGLMILLGLQMLGVKALRKFQLTMPKFITRRVADESKFQGRFMPAVMGAFTFFLPCGFTLTAQGLALLSGSALRGSLIMFLFALGTAPMLLLIGLSSVKFSQKPHLAATFAKTAGILVLFFALFNINAQMNVLGFSSLSDFTSQPAKGAQADDSDLPPLVNGKQLIKMNASSSGYSPSYFKVKAGVPVRWEITDIGTSGCTNAIISSSLFAGQISLTPGQVSVKEFTPEKPGRYKFSCWMGMVSGIMDVVSPSGKVLGTATGAQNANDSAVIPSGAKGCGCGGGGGGSCGGAPK